MGGFANRRSGSAARRAGGRPAAGAAVPVLAALLVAVLAALPVSVPLALPLAVPVALLVGGLTVPAAGQTRDEIRLAQERLTEAGHDPGPADGLMGPQTRRAIADWQAGNGLEPDGQLAGETLARLGRPADSASPNAAATEAPPAETTTTTEAGEAAPAPAAEPVLAGSRLGAATAPQTPRLPGGASAERDGDRRTRPAPAPADRRLTPTGQRPDGSAGPVETRPVETRPVETRPRGTERPERVPTPADRRRTAEAPRPGQSGLPGGERPDGGEEERTRLPFGLTLPSQGDLQRAGIPAVPIPAWLTQYRLALLLIGLVGVSILCHRLSRRRPDRPHPVDQRGPLAEDELDRALAARRDATARPGHGPGPVLADASLAGGGARGG
ncbi:MAG: peptidoglycan-binding protein [Pseudomonadota bacterium]